MMHRHHGLCITRDGDTGFGTNHAGLKPEPPVVALAIYVISSRWFSIATAVIHLQVCIIELVFEKHQRPIRFVSEAAAFALGESRRSCPRHHRRST